MTCLLPGSVIRTCSVAALNVVNVDVVPYDDPAEARRHVGEQLSGLRDIDVERGARDRGID